MFFRILDAEGEVLAVQKENGMELEGTGAARRLTGAAWGELEHDREKVSCVYLIAGDANLENWGDRSSNFNIEDLETCPLKTVPFASIRDRMRTQ